jgi:hypothetical protein
MSCLWALLLTGALGMLLNIPVFKSFVVVTFLASGYVCGLIFSLAFGTTRRSRGLFTLCWVALAVAPLFGTSWAREVVFQW